MGITSTTLLPMPKSTNHGNFHDCLCQGRQHHGHGGHGHVRGHGGHGHGHVHGHGGHGHGGHGHHYGVAGPVVSQPPKHPYGVAGPVVSQPPKHPYGVAGPVVSQPPKHHYGVAGPVVCQPPKHPQPIVGGGVHPNPQPKHPTYPSNEDIYKNSNKFHVGFNKHEYKGRHDKYDVAEFSGPRSRYKFDYAGEGKVSVTDLQTGKKTRLDNIEAVLFNQSVQGSKPGDGSYGYDKEQFYRLAIDGKGIGEGRFKDIRPGTNILNSTKPNPNGVTNVTTGGGNDLLRGSSGDDNLNGGAGRDIFWGGTGDDNINGGSGFDTAAYQRNRNDYYIWKDEQGRIHVKDKTRNTGEDILTSIENLRFGNGNFGLDKFKFDEPPSSSGSGGGGGYGGGSGNTPNFYASSSDPQTIEEYFQWM
jgi:hypothetical protein